jgi:hypothetical protein
MRRRGEIRSKATEPQKREYDVFEHRHRFAVWAAARAAQRGFVTVEKLRDALEATDIVAFV